MNQIFQVLMIMIYWLNNSDGIANQHIEDPLLFWKENETKYPELSKLAKKFLGVPASDADVERMFTKNLKLDLKFNIFYKINIINIFLD